MSAPLLETIEADDPSTEPALSGRISSATNASRAPVVLTPTSRAPDTMATTPGDAESGTPKFSTLLSAVRQLVMDLCSQA